MILSPLVNPVSEAFSELNKSEIEEVRNDVRLRAKTNPKVKPEIEFYRELGRYIFNPKKIREVYEKYECSDEHMDTLLKKAAKKAGITY